MNNLSNEERETNINMSGDDRSVWIVFTDDPIMARKFDRISTAEREGNGGKYYRIPVGQISLRKPMKPKTEAQKAKLAARLVGIRGSAHE